MLGKTPPQFPTKTATPARKSRERAVDFHVVIPDADDAVTRRLVRRIQQSIDRTLAAETPDTAAPAAGDKAAAGSDAAPAQRTRPGCGAWWAF